MDNNLNFQEYRNKVDESIEKNLDFIPFMGVYFSDVNSYINYKKVKKNKNTVYIILKLYLLLEKKKKSFFKSKNS